MRRSWGGADVGQAGAGLVAQQPEKAQDLVGEAGSSSTPFGSTRSQGRRSLLGWCPRPAATDMSAIRLRAVHPQTKSTQLTLRFPLDLRAEKGTVLVDVDACRAWCDRLLPAAVHREHTCRVS